MQRSTRESSRRQFLRRAGSTAAAGAFVFRAAETHSADETWLSRGGKAGGVIVIGKEAGQFYRWVAEELARYLQLLTGADFRIGTSTEAVSEGVRVLVGGPDSNPLAALAQQKKLVDFAGLKRDGFLLHRVNLDGGPALVVGGNDEASTMYAAYELLERLGVVFQLTGDIIPERKPQLELPALAVRMEPALKYRGLHMRHFVMPWVGLDHFRKFIDQLAKLKCNYLEFYWYVGDPWTEYSYRGEKKLIGDLYTKESGYTCWRYDTATFTPEDVQIGREHFGERRACAPEFQDCETPEEAFRAARQFLKQAIEYAHQRKIQVWLGMGDCPGVPPNLGRFARVKRWDPAFGTLIAAGDPAGLEIWKAAIKSVITTYPEADGYWLWLAETYYHSDDAETRKVVRQYEAYRKWIPGVEEIRRIGYDRPKTETELESDVALIHYGKEIAEMVRRDHPSARFGIAVLGRCYLFRAMDALIPKEVAFSSMESSGVWNRHSKVPMELFAGMEQRERFLVPRLDDDESELAMQFNVGLYYHDEALAGSVKHGVSGVAPQTGKTRGLEQNARFIAEAAWNPSLAPEEFYRSYARRIFGEKGAVRITRAFLALAQAEGQMGWRGFGNFLNYADQPEIMLMRLFGMQANPFEGPDERIEKATFHFHAPEQLDARKMESLWVQANSHKYELFGGTIQLLREALRHLRQAEGLIPPGSRNEWTYLVLKSEQFVMHLEAVRALLAGFLAYDKAFKARKAGDEREFLNQLGLAESLFRQARNRSRETAEKIAGWIDDPTEKHILYRYNVRFVLPIDEFCKFIKNVVNFHHGQPYWEKVDWDRIAPSYLTRGNV